MHKTLNLSRNYVVKVFIFDGVEICCQTLSIYDVLSQGKG